MLRGPEGRERACGQLGVWGAVRALLTGSGAETQPKSNGAFLALKSDVMWQQFHHSVVLSRPKTYLFIYIYILFIKAKGHKGHLHRSKNYFEVKNIWGGSASPCL